MGWLDDLRRFFTRGEPRSAGEETDREDRVLSTPDASDQLGGVPPGGRGDALDRSPPHGSDPA